jgi:hypothetical protein
VLYSLANFAELLRSVTARAEHDVTELLLAWSGGDAGALEKLTPLVYRELHRLARSYMVRERSDHTLQTTALINELYVRLINADQVLDLHRYAYFPVGHDEG